jgi:hypothetical protein
VGQVFKNGQVVQSVLTKVPIMQSTIASPSFAVDASESVLYRDTDHLFTFAFTTINPQIDLWALKLTFTGISL